MQIDLIVKNMNGKLQVKSISKAFPVDNTIFEVLILTLLGAAAVALRARLRIPLNLPGHHGLEVMALFMIARNFSKLPIAGTIAAGAGALTMLIPFLGYQNPFLPAIYIFMGIAIDAFYSGFRNMKPKVIFFLLVGGLAYIMIPLLKLALHTLSIYPYQAIIKGGVVYTLSSHFLFGSLGAAAAFGLILSARKIKK